MPAETVSVQDLGDLIANTLPALNKGRYAQIATPLQDYTFASYFLKEGMKEGYDSSGTHITWAVKVSQAGNARNVSLAATDVVNIPDTTVRARADWRYTVTGFAIIANEIDMNKGEVQIIDLLKSRQEDCDIDDAVLMEQNMWGPPVAPDDEITPWGIKTWIVKNANEGFNGMAPAGYTSIGLNPTQYPGWRNYTFTYSNLTDADFYEKLRAAARRTNFKPIISTRGKAENAHHFVSDKYVFATTETVYANAEAKLRAQNENLGMELNYGANQAVFNRQRLIWVPALDYDTTNPIYGLDMSSFKLAVAGRWWNKPTVVAPYPGQHTVIATFYDKQYQFICYNRRGNFVGATAATEPV